MPAAITPRQFVAKWSKVQQKETATYVSHFEDLCRLVGHQTSIKHASEDKAYSSQIQIVQLFDRAAVDKVNRKSVGRADIQELDDIHTALDHAVLDAYGWPHDLTDEQIMERLLVLNLERAEIEQLQIVFVSVVA